jgi:hypothetical protein
MEAADGRSIDISGDGDRFIGFRELIRQRADAAR